MAWRDTTDSAEGKENAGLEKNNKMESDQIGDELEGNKTRDLKEADSPESPKNKGLNTKADIRKEAGNIGKELNGEEIKESFDAGEKRNIDGEKISGPPVLRDDRYGVKGPDGTVIKDDKGNPLVDWKQRGEHELGNSGIDERYDVSTVTLKKGDVIDRYGDESGHWASPEGEPYDKRGLPFEEKSCEYHKYRLNKDIDCEKSIAAGKFDSEGGAVQYHFEKSFDEMLEDGDLEEIE